MRFFLLFFACFFLPLIPHAEMKPAHSWIEDYEFSLLAKSVDPYAVQTDFMRADRLLEGLRIAKRHFEKKPISHEEFLESFEVLHYMLGVFQGFMIGIEVQEFKEHSKNMPRGAPICRGEKSNLEALVKAGLNHFEKIPPDHRPEMMASTELIHAFFDADLYEKCRGKD